MHQGLINRKDTKYLVKVNEENTLLTLEKTAYMGRLGKTHGVVLNMTSVRMTIHILHICSLQVCMWSFGVAQDTFMFTV